VGPLSIPCDQKSSYDIIMAIYGLIPAVQGVPFMWTVIYIAPTAKISETIRRRLTEEGFLVQVRPINLSKQQFEILVPSGELEEVQEVLNSILHS
jgi:hypothetical protein